MTRVISTLLIAFLFLLQISITSSSAQSIGRGMSVDTSQDEAINAIQVLLGLTKESSRPSCDGRTLRVFRFCPLVAKCPSTKPFCISKSTYSGKSNRLVRFECECSSSLDIEEQGGGSGVKGVMSYGQLCPVLRLDEVCSETYFKGDFLVYSVNPGAAKKLIRQGVADANGKFSVKLEPGDYIIEVTQTSSFGKTRVQEFPVTVKKGSYTSLSLRIELLGPSPV